MNLLLENEQLWVLIIGSLVPLVGYILNKVGPQVTEPIKAFVQVIVAAASGALYTALETDVFGWNEPTVSLVLSAIVAALLAHKLLWKPAKINTLLGATETEPVRE